MKMKRILSGLVVIGMSISLLAGCSGASTSTSNSNTASSSTTSKAKVNFPTGPIKYIVPYGAGGSSDIGARLLCSEVEKILGVPVVVENKPGGGGWIGWNDLLHAKKDGYTVANANLPTLTGGYMNPEEKRNNSLKDFAPILNYVRDPSTIAINPQEKRFTNLKELIAYAQKNDVTVGVGSPNSDDHIMLLKMNKAYNLKFIPLFTKGASDNMTALMGKHVDASIIGVCDSYAGAKNGQIKTLAVASTNRAGFLPDVPTVKEAAGIEIINGSSRGVVAAAGVPKEVLDNLIDAFSKAAKSQTFIDKMKEQGLEVAVTAGDDYLKMLQQMETDFKELGPLLGWK
ncbi:MAG: tripartite tricarboxylate transporter family receptor [Clostridiales bacterium]|jgi:tripartite-type tricarboxylate transporter receptor subunit TctC|nr:tripartite tricarboxylate transporter family receptor [Clostridiales bacterium]